MKTFAVPKNIDDHASIAALAARRTELSAEQAILSKEKAEICQRLRQSYESQSQHRSLSESIYHQNEARKRAADEIARTADPVMRRAREIAFGELPAPTDTERLAVIEARLRELNAALGMLHSRIQQARSRASVEICAGLADQHKAIEKTFARKMADATEAALSYHQWVTNLEDAGVQTSSLSHNLPYFLHATDKYDQLAQWFRASVERGVLDRSDVPPKFDWTK